MSFCKIYASCLLFFITITAETIQNEKANEKYGEDIKSDIQRRFLEDLDDKEWHISHLRDTDINVEGECDEETFENKAKKYRETLRNDAALVEFVSGDALPVEKQAVSKNKCKRNLANIFKTKDKTREEFNVTQIRAEKEGNITSNGQAKLTTVSVKETVGREEDVANITSKRRSEYQFSSVEYYDDVQDFDQSVCPDAVEVITLEMDQLRNYDVKCEALLEWRSLD